MQYKERMIRKKNPSKMVKSQMLGIDGKLHTKQLGAYMQPTEINALGATRNFQWIWAAGDDGFIRRINFFKACFPNSTKVMNDHISNDKETSANIPMSGNYGEFDYGAGSKTLQVSKTWCITEKNNVAIPKAMFVDPDGIWAAVGLRNGGIKIVTLRKYEGHPHTTLGYDTEQVTSVDGSTTGNILAAAYASKKTRIWDLTQGKEINSLNNFNSYVSWLGWSRNSLNNILLLSTLSGELKICDVRHNAPAVIFSHANLASRSGWAPTADWLNDHQVVCGRKSGWFELWDTRMNRIVINHKVSIQSGPVYKVKVHPDEHHVVIANVENIKIVDLPNGINDNSTQSIISHGGGAISDMCFDERGNFLAISSGTKECFGRSSQSLLLFQLETTSNKTTFWKP